MANSQQMIPGSSDAFDTTRRFVRVTGERGDFIEFDFAVGEPEVFVELILSREAFSEFCKENDVEILAPKSGSEGAVSDWDWRLADARNSRFKQ